MRLLLALIVLAIPFGLQASEPPQSIEEFVDKSWPESGAPGVAYAVIEDGKVRTGVRGKTLSGGTDEITPDTPFLIGSISKSFAALAIMQLVESEKIDLEASVGTYLDAFSDRPSSAITIRQLLSHTSGYSTVQGNSLHGNASRSEGKLADHVADVAQWEPAYAPGERWEYSNANYHVLGAVIEAVSGQDYASYIEANILRPLGMDSSFVSDGRIPGKIAIPHRPWFGGKRAYDMGRTTPVGAPAGGIFASANDLALYLAMMLDGEDNIITAASKSQMLQPASDASPFYGLGWFIDVEARTASHSGLVPGTETLATLVPADGKGVVVLVNANGGIGFGENFELRNGITARALNLDYSGEGSRFWPQFTYLMMVSLPIIFALSAGWAWLRREQLRAKSGALGMFSLWFPLIATSAMAFALIVVVPQMFGGSIGTMLLFQPDFGWAMVAAAVAGPIWAIVRLTLAYRK
ncbi:serine hydrolase domain-containing protein [Erythrobacter sp. F6033]|uniref:serine hydrolase domain-containing protein n=1 Tax=Erythrobacter sp. F6033 TaxID=2926401 RepID=UPI001FF1A3FB|nr:serine hydrolase domain-containing protein [Erythrobacter sp. F6033]MCK0127096.1 beta-lactamase family protein [Erythrobacter sp. F6033]